LRENAIHRILENEERAEHETNVDARVGIGGEFVIDAIRPDRDAARRLRQESEQILQNAACIIDRAAHDDGVGASGVLPELPLFGEWGNDGGIKEFGPARRLRKLGAALDDGA
jgi:hypothetical protein